MRKILITFVVSIILVISGALVFAMELAQIQFHTVEIDSQPASYKTTVAQNIDPITIDAYPSNYSGYSDLELKIDEMSMDPALAENEIVIEYPNLFEVHEIGHTDDRNDMIINFSYSLNMDTNIFSQSENWADLMRIWRTKEVDIPFLNADSLKLQIRYGKNLENRIHVNTSFVG
ncbi:hypothetical protein [Faecalicoccus pleomorphus]|uniref:hypothetical protein n=1 Tax=Faecalicoccus pleomorphus TaxID=1323 RepID=UPI0022E621EE|nr:hypothetical protein [Faecalicoccus pleomorphus]